MSKMNWWKAGKLYRRPTLDWKYEESFPDAADRWIAKALSQQAQRGMRLQKRRSFNSTTSSTEVPW
jgi:hypothetical protein